MSKKANQIYGALHNTLDKLKAVIRKGKPVPPVKDIYQWFTTISPVEIKTEHPPINSIHAKDNHFETIFFFNGMRVYLSLIYRHAEYRGHPYIDFTTEIYFIDEFYPDDDLEEEKIKYLQDNFHIQIPNKRP